MSFAISQHSSWPLSEFSPRDVGLGAIGSSIALTQGYVTMKGAESLMRSWGIQVDESQTVFRIYDSLDNIANPLLRISLKAIAIVYVILLMPVVEEWFFREWIYRKQLSENFEQDTRVQKAYRILTNGLIFGAFHLGPFRGWVGIPIFAVSAISGIIFAILREMTQNLWASTIAHSLNNTFVLFITLFKI